MYWQSAGFPTVTREQMFACKLHSFAAIFAVVKRELEELQQNLLCDACFSNARAYCDQLIGPKSASLICPV